jgi:hypothetical protein
MMNILKLTTSLFLFALFCSCISTSYLEDEISGKWQWECSLGVFAGGISTPESQRKTMSIVIKKDGTYLRFENDKLRRVLVFHVSIFSNCRMGWPSV